MNAPNSREVPVELGKTALLIVDLQNYCAHREAEAFASLSPAEFAARYGYFFDRLEGTLIPNIGTLQDAFRAAGQEVIFTVIESLTRDGRDRSLDYKITGFNVPRGSWDARVLEPIAPRDDEIVLPKTSSSVFISTTLDYVLRNLDVRYLVLAGVLTDQCVESAVRDACDLGYLVTLVPDACATYSQERHDNSLHAIAGYCRQRSTAQIVSELDQAQAGTAVAMGGGSAKVGFRSRPGPS